MGSRGRTIEVGGSLPSFGYFIQGVSGGKVTILPGDIIGHCEKKYTYEHVSNSEWLPRENCLNLPIQKHCE